MRGTRILAVGITLTAWLGISCRDTSPVPAAKVSTPAPFPALSASDQLLLVTAKIALPPPGTAAGDLPEPNSPGAVMLAKYCAQCHNLPSPTTHSATDWPSVVRRMWLRGEKLPAEFNIQLPDVGERSTVLTYLTAHALQVSRATLPRGRGREEFMNGCSRCHALPDPRVHSKPDWLAVIMRMERNMERMNVAPATRDQIGAIVQYLEGAGAVRN